MAELRTPQGHTLLLPEGCVSIGADPANDVPVAAHLGLAPVHFRLQPWEGGHFLEDAGSGLGTLVNGHSVNWKPLTHGDRITAGDLEIVYDQQSEAANRPVPVIVVPSPQAPMGSLPFPANLIPVVPPPPSPYGSLPSGDSPACNPSRLPNPTQLPAAHPVPPAWLPVDLLPESYQLPPAQPETAPGEQTNGRMPAAPALPPRRVKSPAPRRFRRRLLPLAALCAILAWGGHTAWQRGHLAPLLQSLRPAPRPALPHPAMPENKDKTPATAASPPYSVPRSIPNPTKTTRDAGPGLLPSPAAVAPTAEIATQRER